VRRLALIIIGVAVAGVAEAQTVTAAFKKALLDRHLTAAEARAIVAAAHGPSAEAQRWVDRWADRFDPDAQTLIAQIAPRNSCGTVRAQLRQAVAQGGQVSEADARRVVEVVRRDGFTPAERRELVRQVALLGDKVSENAAQVFEGFRLTRDALTPDPWNQKLPITPGGDGNRVADPRTGSTWFAIASGCSFRDGLGHERGKLALSHVRINFGQRRELAGEPYVYILGAAFHDASGAIMKGSGWVPERALASGPLTYMPTIVAPFVRGYRPEVYKITGGSKALNDRLEKAHVKVIPDVAKNDRAAATDYLLRQGGDVNLLYNLPGTGGVSVDTFPVGTAFARASGIAPVQIDLYAPESKAKVGKMTFVYGRAGTRRGWIALDAISR
jgi:hypothetical protein